MENSLITLSLPTSHLRERRFISSSTKPASGPASFRKLNEWPAGSKLWLGKPCGSKVIAMSGGRRNSRAKNPPRHLGGYVFECAVAPSRISRLRLYTSLHFV